jgi:hypothetical protein
MSNNIRPSLSFLTKPYPLTANSGLVRMSIMYGVFVFLFLFLFQPFGLATSQTVWLLSTAAIYGVITFSTTLFSSLGARKLAPHFFIEKKWTFARELSMTMMVVLLIGVFNLLYSDFKFNFGLSINDFLLFQFYTLAVGIFPTIILMLIRMNRLTKMNSSEAVTLSNSLQIRKNEDGINDFLTIASELKSDDLLLPIDELIYIESADNYINICFLENGLLSQKLIRSTLGKVEAEAEKYDCLIRCHRAYLVNLNHVRSFSGNAQGLQLQLSLTDTSVPVSRKMVAEIRSRLK